MNRTEKLIVALLFAMLMGWLWYSNKTNQKQREEQARQQPAAAALSTNTPALSAAGVTHIAPVAPVEATNTPPPIEHLIPEQTFSLHNGDIDLTLSSRGATLLAATLPRYHAAPTKHSGPVILDFHPQPLLALNGLPGIAADVDYAVSVSSSNRVATCSYRTPQGVTVERRVELRGRHQVLVTDRIGNASTQPVVVGSNSVTLGTMYRGSLKNDEISADSYGTADSKVKHWSGDLPKLFGGGAGFGCGGGAGRNAPEHSVQTVDAPQRWVALKSRFFVETFASSVPNAGFCVDAVRDPSAAQLTIARVSGSVAFAGAAIAAGDGLERSYRLYIGPKKLSYLDEMDERMDEIMEFGFFAWFCKPLVSLLNIFYKAIPNYGVAIILLTLLVRVVFWPLTHKSTESARRMRDVQPKIKEIQAQFKDEPQKLQQEIWKVYRENKVNPLSSCLPMLVQLPVFIALYTVLRSAVDLRFAPFLWVNDLSQPENLLAGVLPIPINVLPLLMAAVTVWQSKLTPTMGDPAQQKMMTWMMPGMMLFFFYSMPAALSLYWTVSTLLAIVQLKWQQRSADAGAAGGPQAPTDSQPPMTRQMRRHLGK